MNKYIKPSWTALIILFFVLSLPLFSVATTIKGTVKDKTADAPLAGVKITLVSLKNSTVRFELETDEKGNYYKTGLEHGMYEVTFEKKGYMPVKETIRLRLGDDNVKNVVLEIMEIKASEGSFGLIAAAQKLMESGKYDEAIGKISQAIEKEPGIFLLYYDRAIAYERKGDKDKALADFKKALEFKPDFLLAHSAIGNIYAKKSEFSEAVNYFKKALDQGLTDTVALYNYGACLINLGNNDEARAIFEKLIELDPSYADAYYQLGIICLGMNDNAKAKEHLNKFIELDPENSNVSVAKEILQSLE